MGGTAASMFVIPALPTFLQRYPEIQLELGVSDHLIDLLSENVDCVIRGGSLTNLERSLVARHVGDFPLVTCATPAYLKRHGTPRYPVLEIHVPAARQAAKKAAVSAKLCTTGTSEIP